MEAGQAGPPGRLLRSRKGLPKRINGQDGQNNMLISEGYAGAPGEEIRILTVISSFKLLMKSS